MQLTLPSHSRLHHSRTTAFQKTSIPGHKKHWHRQQLCPRAQAASTSGAGGSFDADDLREKAREFADGASRKFQKFVSDNKLDEAAQQVQENAEKLGNQAARKAKETFEEADKRLSLRVRARNLYLYVKETTPKVQREVSAFAETPLGRVAMFLAVAWAAYTGLLLRLINFFFLAVWLSPLFLPLVARIINKKAVEEAERQAAGGAYNPGRTAAGGQRYCWYAPPHMRQQQWDPNAAKWGPAGPAGAPGGPSAGRRDAAQQQQQRYSQAGPVIDAEWTTIDEGDQK